MASKAHVDNTVNERRLRPIYDWLDNGNNKKALQEADKVLRKQPSNQCARVLKALALLRLGKEDECGVIMDKVRAEVPCDDSTLQAMSICYREIHQPEKISKVYEAAAKADPNNEELLTHLFMSYVRLGDFKKQQQTALTLYKLKPKNPYYFWAVMSVVMQAMQADEKLAKGVILPLAERMELNKLSNHTSGLQVLKLVNEGKIEAEQEVQLYLMVLELQGKDEEALKVLSGPLATRLSSLPQRKAALQLQLKRFPEAAAAFKQLIDQDPDNWAYYRDHLLAALNFQSPLECLEILNEKIRNKGNKARAPHLARFELLKRARESETEGQLNFLNPIELMRQYFGQFGEKGCVVGDLRLYLNLLTPVERLHLLQKIGEDVNVGDTEYPGTAGQMQRHIHLEQLRRSCGLHHSPSINMEERRRLVNRLVELYEQGDALCPSHERLPTDFCPADTYALLAAHLLYQLWVESEGSDASYLYRAMTVLERSLLSSPANFHIKILLVRAYLEAGLAGAASDVFELLDAKHIQLDSLGHLHASLLAPLGDLWRAATTLDHAAKFFIANYKDSADHLTFAYKYGSFVKIQEFVEFRERLENSLHFAMTTVDKMLLELTWCDSQATLTTTLSSMRVQPHEDSIRWDLLRDNRDLEVVLGWEPLDSSGKDPRMRDETRTCMLRLLASRSLMLRLVAAASESDSSPLLSRLSSELAELNQERVPSALADLEQGTAGSVLIPMDAVERLREAHDSEQLSLVAGFADSLARFSRPDPDCLRVLSTSPCLGTLPIPSHESPVSFKRYLLRATTCGETLAILGAICCASAIQAQPTAVNKKNRKKSGKEIPLPPSDQIPGGWSEVCSLLAERVRALDSSLSVLEKVQLQTGLNTEEKAVAIVMERGRSSIAQSCRELKSRAALTLKLLNSLVS